LNLLLPCFYLNWDWFEAHFLFYYISSQFVWQSLFIFSFYHDIAFSRLSVIVFKISSSYLSFPSNLSYELKSMCLLCILTAVIAVSIFLCIPCIFRPTSAASFNLPRSTTPAVKAISPAIKRSLCVNFYHCLPSITFAATVSP